MPILHRFDVPLNVEKESFRFDPQPWHDRFRPENSQDGMAPNKLKMAVFDPTFGHREPAMPCFGTPMWEKLPFRMPINMQIFDPTFGHRESPMPCFGTPMWEILPFHMPINMQKQ